MSRALLLRHPRGLSIPEFAAALVIGLPILIAILFTALECSTYFTIKTKLDVAARTAARQLAIAYGKDQTVAQNPHKSNPAIAAIYDSARITPVINDKDQFSDPTFVEGTPGTVTVVVSYPEHGEFNTQPFPHLPGVLPMLNGLRPRSMATFALE
jgi:Flp pilus assembly protein TadG